MSMESNVVILPVKAKKHNGADVKVDPLFHANRMVIHQESPIIPPRIWEKCRRKDSEFEDAYGMVCNNPSAVSNVLPTADIEHDLEEELTKLCIVNKIVGNGTCHNFTYDPQHSKCLPRCSMSFSFYITLYQTLTKLLFSFFHVYLALNGQPCMVLSTRFFYVGNILDLVCGQSISQSDFVVEVTELIYNESPSLDSFVCAREVVFGPKGMSTCNHSM